MAALHPIYRPPGVAPGVAPEVTPGVTPGVAAGVVHGQHPVRDDSKLAPTEDLDREPDGVPHDVVGLTALFSVMLAMLVAFMFMTGSTVARVAAVMLAAIAIPMLVALLRNKAANDRDQLHPSR